MPRPLCPGLDQPSAGHLFEKTGTVVLVAEADPGELTADSSPPAAFLGPEPESCREGGFEQYISVLHAATFCCSLGHPFPRQAPEM